MDTSLTTPKSRVSRLGVAGSAGVVLSGRVFRVLTLRVSVVVSIAVAAVVGSASQAWAAEAFESEHPEHRRDAVEPQLMNDVPPPAQAGGHSYGRHHARDLSRAPASARILPESRSAPVASPEPNSELEKGAQEVSAELPELSAEDLAQLEEAMQADADMQVPSDLPVDPGSPTTGLLGTFSRDNGGLQLALIMDAAGAWFSGESDQQGAHDPKKTGFNFQQLELSANANIDHVFRFETNLVFLPTGVEIEEAYGKTLSLPAGLQLRAGQFLTRFGRQNATHPHAWHFADQSLVLGKLFGGEGSRGLGLEASILLPLPWYVEIVASATDATGGGTARSFYGDAELRLRGPKDLLATTAVKQFFALSDNLGLAWGVSGQFGPNSTGPGNRSEIYGTDIYLRYRPVDSNSRTAISLTFEALHRRRQVPSQLLVDSGFLSSLVWNITPRWETGARYEYVQGVLNDPMDAAWDRNRQRASLQGTFYPSHFSRIRLQGNSTRSGGDDLEHSIFLALELLAGAHGSHAY